MVMVGVLIALAFVVDIGTVPMLAALGRRLRPPAGELVALEGVLGS